MSTVAARAAERNSIPRVFGIPARSTKSGVRPLIRCGDQIAPASPNVAILVALLVRVHPRPVTAERAVLAVWGDKELRNVRNSLDNLVHDARAILQPLGWDCERVPGAACFNGSGLRLVQRAIVEASA
jgi:hypothetical protein